MAAVAAEVTGMKLECGDNIARLNPIWDRTAAGRLTWAGDALPGKSSRGELVNADYACSMLVARSVGN